MHITACNTCTCCVYRYVSEYDNMICSMHITACNTNTCTCCVYRYVSEYDNIYIPIRFAHQGVLFGKCKTFGTCCALSISAAIRFIKHTVWYGTKMMYR